MTAGNGERFNMRLDADLKSKIERAAKLKGLNPTGYAKAVLAAAASRDIEEQEFLSISQKDREAFARSIIEPIEPSAKSVEAALRYKERFGL
ncbi:MAG: DUF1778 domain-containing protein [Cyanobacteria bacterium SZAS LIN-2]|nr:DUF1778 domain-containing protein [Cyanobacteria bacterium SZAS LIN-3]MBS1998421.1 DUF1778 domain-containing protein [Cyanobacteria bacterium SZAS LIN-2]